MAQRLERTPDKGEMGGSIPLSPTIFKLILWLNYVFLPVFKQQEL